MASNLKQAAPKLFGPFKTLLVANRGEIACRIIRTARRLGFRTVAVYSNADRHALHVRLADDACHIGPSPPQESYLCVDRILEAAQKSGAEAIHPGYGFLSENAEFAGRCVKEDIVFVGPPAKAISKMASKEAARKLMESADVPVIPGFAGSQDTEILRHEATRVGFPLLIKPTMGGGGIGMVIAHHEREFCDSLAAARREAEKAFGNGDVLLERWLPKSRHVELQIVRDWHGNAIHLFERDCSIQRRHQKIIEEAPAPNLPPSVRESMGKSALAAAHAADYRNCGTVEFILDTHREDTIDQEFFFLEMNTRLQVEHPVTEMITGLDLVEWQLKIASGEKLPILDQATANCRGHAMEARIYSECPSIGFLPQTGTLKGFSFPEKLGGSEDGGVRVDTGFAVGDVIGMDYDPMIAKVIAWGEDREKARSRLSNALSFSSNFGVRTNIEFAARAVNMDEFVSGKFDSGTLERNEAIYKNPELSVQARSESAIAAAIAVMQISARNLPSGLNEATEFIGFRVNEGTVFELECREEGEKPTQYYDLRVELQRPKDSKPYNCKIDFGREEKSLVAFAEVERFRILHQGASGELSAKIELEMSIFLKEQRRRERFVVDLQGNEMLVHRSQFDRYPGDLKYRLYLPDYEELMESQSTRLNSSSLVRSPMPGRVLGVPVREGDNVREGDILLEIEAMKMTHQVRAPYDCKISRVAVHPSSVVDDTAVLMELSAAG